MPDRSTEPAALDLGWGLSVLLRAYLQRGNDSFADLPGGPRAYQVLVSVVRGEPESQMALARRLGIDRTVMTYLIDDMSVAGLVERQVDPGDRRARRIVATAKGRRLLPSLDRRLADLEQDVLEGLAPRDRARLCTLVREAAEAIDRTDHSEDPRDLTRALRGGARRRR